MAKKGLDKIMESRDQYDSESQKLIDSIKFSQIELEKISSMKKTTGWKILDTKIREELHNRIDFLIKDDKTIQTLLSLLAVADTNSMSKHLEEVIDSFLPSQE